MGVEPCARHSPISGATRQAYASFWPRYRTAPIVIGQTGDPRLAETPAPAYSARGRDMGAGLRLVLSKGVALSYLLPLGHRKPW